MIEAYVLDTLGTIQQELGQYAVAIDFHRQALALIHEPGNRYAKAEALIGLTNCHCRLGDCDLALELVDQALSIATQAGYRVLEGRARTTLAEIHLADGQPELAVDEARKAVDLHRATGHQLGLRKAQRLCRQTESHLAIRP